MIEPIHLEFVQELPLEPKLHPPDRASSIPSIARPQVFKPQLARPLDLPRLVVDAARDRPTRRERQPCPVQPIGIILYLHIPLCHLITFPLARPRHKLPPILDVFKTPSRIRAQMLLG